MVRFSHSRCLAGKVGRCAVAALALATLAQFEGAVAQSTSRHGARWDAPVELYAERASAARSGDRLRDRRTRATRSGSSRRHAARAPSGSSAPSGEIGLEGRVRPRPVIVGEADRWSIMTAADLANRSRPRAENAVMRVNPAAPRSGSSGAHRKIGRPYQVNGVWYVPARDDDYREIGVASWYGPGFHGRETANGELFDENALTAAHPTLPLPSFVQVTNLENGRSVTVRVNDRGPYADDRIIDLSRASARQLGFMQTGTARVRVEFVSDAPLPHEAPRSGASPPARLINVSASPREAVYRAPEPPAAERRSSSRAASAGVIVQAAAFSTRERADAVVARFGSHPAYVERARVNGRTVYRVLVGPLASWRAAEEARRMAARLGFADARVVSSR